MRVYYEGYQTSGNDKTWLGNIPKTIPLLLIRTNVPTYVFQINLTDADTICGEKCTGKLTRGALSGLGHGFNTL